MCDSNESNGSEGGDSGIRGIAGIAKIIENFSKKGGTDSDIVKILNKVNNMYATGWNVTEPAEEIEKILMELELPYNKMYQHLYVVDGEGNPVGIYPHYVSGDDGGITLGYGHYVSPDEIFGDKKSDSESELLYTYVPEDTSLFYIASSGSTVVPGADYMPISVAEELLHEDLIYHLQKLKERLAKEDENRFNELNQKQLSALLLIRYQWGSLGSELTRLVIDDASKEKWISYFMERDNGKISERHNAAIEIYFGADYSEFY